MGWIIDKDHFADKTKTAPCNANAVGMIGPRSYKGDGKELKVRFRLLDDDGELYYEGRSSSNSDFGPLEDFAMPNAGCTIIQYKDQHGVWQDL
jgi:hypothetical protein